MNATGPSDKAATQDRVGAADRAAMQAFADPLIETTTAADLEAAKADALFTGMVGDQVMASVYARIRGQVLTVDPQAARLAAAEALRALEWFIRRSCGPTEAIQPARLADVIDATSYRSSNTQTLVNFEYALREGRLGSVDPEGWLEVTHGLLTWSVALEAGAAHILNVYVSSGEQRGPFLDLRSPAHPRGVRLLGETHDLLHHRIAAGA